MAKCEVKTTTKQVMTTVEEKSYVLELTQEEAEFIKSFAGICAGSSPLPTKIFEALRLCDVVSRDIHVDIKRTEQEDGKLEYVYFKNLGDYK